MGTDPPTVRNTKKGEATIFTHREYLGDLKTPSFATGGGATSPFTIDSYPLNPGNSDLFPWLATIAHNFQEWELRGMIVELKTLSSNYAAGLSMGAMFAATQYNVLAPPPANKIELENMEYATSSRPSNTCLHAIECARGNDTLTHLYVATDINYNSGDARLYDLGNLYIGSFGIPVSNSPIAEIWVTYEVALYKPTLPSSVGEYDTAHFIISGITNAIPWGTSVTRTAESSQVVTVTTNAGSGATGNYNIQMPNKIARYLVVVAMDLPGGQTMSNTGWGFTPGVGNDCEFYYGFTDENVINAKNFTSNRNGIGAAGVSTGSIQVLYAVYIVQVPQLTSGVLPQATITFAPFGMTGSTMADVWITQISMDVL